MCVLTTDPDECYVRERGALNGKPLGGDERTRTADPLLAKQVLYQLSYVPALTSTSEAMGTSVENLRAYFLSPTRLGASRDEADGSTERVRGPSKARAPW